MPLPPGAIAALEGLKLILPIKPNPNRLTEGQTAKQAWAGEPRAEG